MIPEAADEKANNSTIPPSQRSWEEGEIVGAASMNDLFTVCFRLPSSFVLHPTEIEPSFRQRSPGWPLHSSTRVGCRIGPSWMQMDSIHRRTEAEDRKKRRWNIQTKKSKGKRSRYVLVIVRSIESIKKNRCLIDWKRIPNSVQFIKKINQFVQQEKTIQQQKKRALPA